ALSHAHSHTPPHPHAHAPSPTHTHTHTRATHEIASAKAALEKAEELRKQFCRLEDLRNEINPIRVLHRAVDLAGIAETGPMYPMLGELSEQQAGVVGQAAQELKALDCGV
ncbi:MAG: hypothetical protein NXI32_07230, partial [bacterium]|nr:hypothetical protein [bacterium]